MLTAVATTLAMALSAPAGAEEPAPEETCEWVSEPPDDGTGGGSEPGDPGTGEGGGEDPGTGEGGEDPGTGEGGEDPGTGEGGEGPDEPTSPEDGQEYCVLPATGVGSAGGGVAEDSAAPPAAPAVRRSVPAAKPAAPVRSAAHFTG